ncbi:MAG: extracellular solute-binding protein [Erysipelotrichaceae bacterium]|nr:extracellular solute-binding protein [Erysipelotrichaceae bacterium]
MKRLLTILLCAIMLVSFAGCSSSDGGSASTDSNEPVTITIWGTWTNAQKEALEKYAADFTASQDKYTVVYEDQVYDGFSGTLQNAVVAGVGPDIVIDYASTAATYLDLGRIADISKYIDASYVSTLTDGAYEESHSYVEDGMYNYPIVLSGPVIWYNPEILEAAGVEVPTTWDEMFAASKTISETVTVVTDANGNKTYVTDGTGEHIYGFASDSHTDIAETWIKQLGGDIYDTAAEEAVFNTPEFAAMLQQYQDGINDSSLMSGPTGDYLSNDFNAGIVAMYYGSVAGAPYLQATHEAAKVPTVAGGTAWTSAWQRGVLIFDYADEARIEGAVAFLEYFASPEINEDWCEKCNYTSCLKWTTELDSYQAFLAENTSLQCLEPEIAGTLPAVPAQSAVRTALKNLITNVGAGTNVDEALAEAVQYVADNK